MPEHERTVLVQTGGFGVNLFTSEAVELDEQGVAHNLIENTEYVVLNDEDSRAYINGEVQISPDDSVEDKFTVMFPGLDSFKTSVTAYRSQTNNKLQNK